MAPNMLHF